MGLFERIALAPWLFDASNSDYGMESHMFANSPMQQLVKAAIAAVAVTRSRLISCTHNMYSGSESHKSVLSAGQTQFPPDWETILALTAMIYAIAKKVAKPALISVKKKEPGRALGC